LAYAEWNEGRTFTGAPWRFYHYGPWAADVHARIEPALRAIDAIEKSIPSNDDDDFKRWSKADDSLFERLRSQLPTAVASRVRDSVHRYGKDTAELLHFVYTTQPMLEAAPNDTLVFRPITLASHSAEQRAATSLSHKQQKRRDAQDRAVKERVAQKLATKMAEQQRQPKAVAPRYDEVFIAGVEWLDGLAGEQVGSSSGTVSFNDDVWKSPIRSEPRD
jgi:hypothetical protein